MFSLRGTFSPNFIVTHHVNNALGPSIYSQIKSRYLPVS